MSCAILPSRKKLDATADCKCHTAVLRAYKTLVADGRPDICALQVAKIVYNFHHPEDPKDTAAITVERWVYADRLQ